jgi:hypothetical protein
MRMCWKFRQFISRTRSIDISINFLIFDGLDDLKPSRMVSSEWRNIINIVGKNNVIFIAIQLFDGSYGLMRFFGFTRLFVLL